jgi:hypothetical protein
LFFIFYFVKLFAKFLGKYRVGKEVEMATRKKSKKKGSSAPKKQEKPHFACKHYPECPDREGSTLRVLEEADEEEGMPATTTRDYFPVKGPCSEECHIKRMNTPINHFVMMLTPFGVIDIGS